MGPWVVVVALLLYQYNVYKILHTQLYTGVLEVVEQVLHGHQTILILVQI